MDEKVTHGEVLDALLCMFLAASDPELSICSSEAFGIPQPERDAAYRAMADRPGTLTERILGAIVAEEATDRLETARAALLDAAAEVASVVDARIWHHLSRTEGEALQALCAANNEWQESQLQAYSPHEATGLVEVSDG